MRILLTAVLLLLACSAHACRFARDTQPEYWFEWASALFSADVTSVEQVREKSRDVIKVNVVETFKGPEGAYATLEVPSRMWASCLLERPEVGARVLVALNPNGDALLVPLTTGYADRMREQAARMRPRSAVSNDATGGGARLPQ